MPRLLVNRFVPDSIVQFRATAAIRNEDAWQLARAGRRTAAIYLWGYAAEMTLKAAWFALIRHPEHSPILAKDLRTAVQVAQNNYGIVWPTQGRLHAVLHWAELLLQHRIALRGGYPDPAFGVAVVEHSHRIYDRWREVIRYKKNTAYPSEVRAVAQSTHWLLSNALDL